MNPFILRSYGEINKAIPVCGPIPYIFERRIAVSNACHYPIGVPTSARNPVPREFDPMIRPAMTLAGKSDCGVLLTAPGG
jgi:hypothetical protein